MSAEKLTMAAAINTALRDAMRADDSVLVFGEDVGPLGGVFRVTEGLADSFGAARCFDTPLAESGILGMAIGLAMNGMRPVVEMQFDAFAYPAFEQITSHLAKMRNRTRGALRLPVVVRVPYAGGIGGVEHHCDSSESYYAHTPGLTVLAPATSADAYGLLRAAIEYPDPVIFLEPKKRYFASEETDIRAPVAPIGTAELRRAGRDATLIAYGPSVPVALAAAEQAAAEGRELGVLDLRSLVPLDEHTVTEAVRATGRAVVIAETPGFASVAAELAALIGERCFHHLEAPVRRVTGFDIPYPPPKLERHHLPSIDRILDAVDELQWEYA
ncbi:alpha-ketoacid dehydrogenase subunit beta [Sciscionella sediminilitoris]|uniref:alpha-ketoacid dehydrogenase subunit beta n=1 Tax=Sciscionella sediminilitoris TaxID=1445613 RepID=UPI0004DF11AE|nr:alpha-ketoacid dehydrogenase subunit beta [Sciscionella sp. SE31]